MVRPRSGPMQLKSGGKVATTSILTHEPSLSFSSPLALPIATKLRKGWGRCVPSSLQMQGQMQDRLPGLFNNTCDSMFPPPSPPLQSFAKHATTAAPSTFSPPAAAPYLVRCSRCPGSHPCWAEEGALSLLQQPTASPRTRSGFPSQPKGCFARRRRRRRARGGDTAARAPSRAPAATLTGDVIPRASAA